MKKVVETFMHDGMPYFVGMEVADDPELSWAEKRGLIEEIKEAKTEKKAEPKPKKATKKK